MCQHNAAVALVRGFGVACKELINSLDDGFIDNITITGDLNISIADDSLLNGRLVLFRGHGYFSSAGYMSAKCSINKRCTKMYPPPTRRRKIRSVQWSRKGTSFSGRRLLKLTLKRKAEC